MCSHNLPNGRAARLLLGALSVLVIAAVAMAHEGHEPLPTKGAQVDLKKGLIRLSAQSHRALGVKVAEVAIDTVQEKILAYATLQSPWQKHRYVGSRIAGRIARLYVKPGQRVASGKRLADVESIELEELQLTLINAHNEALLSEETLARAEKLTGQQAMAAGELAEAKSDHHQKLASVRIARGKLLSVGIEAGEIEQVLDGSNPPIRVLPILSPLSGIVTHSDLAVGKVVEPQEHLFEVTDLSSVLVEIGVLEHDLHRIVEGQPIEVSVTAYPKKVFRSTVRKKGAYLDPDTHLGSVWSELENPRGDAARLLPGMHGQSQIVVSQHADAIVVPSAAVVHDGTEQFVLIEEAATSKGFEYRKQSVIVGVRTQAQTQILGDSVFPGDRVVTAGSHELAKFFVQGVLRLSPEAATNIGFAVQPARRHVVENVLEVDGSIELPPEGRAFVSSQLSGTFERLMVEIGDSVEAGQVLAEVSSLELQRLQLELLQAHLEIESLDETLGRIQAPGAVARRRLLEKQSNRRAALNSRESASRQLQAIGVSEEQIDGIVTREELLGVLPIRAPIDGVVVRLNKVLGQAIQKDEPLLEVHDLSRVIVEGHLTERDVGRVRMGMPARVRVAANPAFLATGTVVRSGRRFGSEDRTLSVWVEFKKPPKILLERNMLARLSLILDRPEPTLALPRDAVLRTGTRTFVFVQRHDGILERRAIETGRSDDRFIEVTRGLKRGDRIAIRGAAALQTAYASLR